MSNDDAAALMAWRLFFVRGRLLLLPKKGNNIRTSFRALDTAQLPR